MIEESQNKDKFSENISNSDESSSDESSSDESSSDESNSEEEKFESPKKDNQQKNRNIGTWADIRLCLAKIIEYNEDIDISEDIIRMIIDNFVPRVIREKNGIVQVAVLVGSGHFYGWSTGILRHIAYERFKYHGKPRVNHYDNGNMSKVIEVLRFHKKLILRVDLFDKQKEIIFNSETIISESPRLKELCLEFAYDIINILKSLGFPDIAGRIFPEIFVKSSLNLEYLAERTILGLNIRWVKKGEKFMISENNDRESILLASNFSTA